MIKNQTLVRKRNSLKKKMIKKQFLVKKRNSLIKMTIKNLILEKRKAFLKGMIITKLILEIKRKHQVLLITLNILAKNHMKLLNLMMINALLLIIRKSLKIEKDLRVLNLINLKKVN